jgi:hypothetical protein
MRLLADSILLSKSGVTRLIDRLVAGALVGDPRASRTPAAPKPSSPRPGWIACAASRTHLRPGRISLGTRRRRPRHHQLLDARSPIVPSDRRTAGPCRQSRDR